MPRNLEGVVTVCKRTATRLIVIARARYEMLPRSLQLMSFISDGCEVVVIAFL